MLSDETKCINKAHVTLCVLEIYRKLILSKKSLGKKLNSEIFQDYQLAQMINMKMNTLLLTNAKKRSKLLAPIFPKEVKQRTAKEHFSETSS